MEKNVFFNIQKLQKLQIIRNKFCKIWYVNVYSFVSPYAVIVCIFTLVRGPHPVVRRADSVLRDHFWWRSEAHKQDLIVE